MRARSFIMLGVAAVLGIGAVFLARGWIESQMAALTPMPPGSMSRRRPNRLDQPEHDRLAKRLKRLQAKAETDNPPASA